MRRVSCHNGKLYASLHAAQDVDSAAARGFTSGLAALDAILPGGGFALGAVHELLADPRHGTPLRVAMLLARWAATATPERAIAWCDREDTIYPPAVAAAGLPLDQLCLIRPPSAADLLWAAAACLGCAGVGATVAPVGRLSRVEARRLQLAAERGGGVGLLLRPTGAISSNYAAATRWLVCPLAGDAAVQRWSLRLVHGHGGRVGAGVMLEVGRDGTTTAGHVRAVDGLADRPRQATPARASA